MTPEPRRLFWQEAKNPRLRSKNLRLSQKPQTGDAFWGFGEGVLGVLAKKGEGVWGKIEKLFSESGCTFFGENHFFHRKSERGRLVFDQLPLDPFWPKKC